LIAFNLGQHVVYSAELIKSCHVVDDTYIYSEVLTKVENGRNAFYIIQLLKVDEESKYLFYLTNLG
jgi:hypothetical protein